MPGVSNGVAVNVIQLGIDHVEFACLREARLRLVLVSRRGRRQLQPLGVGYRVAGCLDTTVHSSPCLMREPKVVFGIDGLYPGPSSVAHHLPAAMVSSNISSSRIVSGSQHCYQNAAGGGRSMEMTGGQALAQSLKIEGADTLFALPGIQMDYLFDAIWEEQDHSQGDSS